MLSDGQLEQTAHTVSRVVMWSACVVAAVLIYWAIAPRAMAGPVDLIWEGPSEAQPGEFVSWTLTADGYETTQLNSVDITLQWDGDAVALADLDPVDYDWPDESVYYTDPGDLRWMCFAEIPFPETDLGVQEFRWYVWEDAPLGDVIFTPSDLHVYDETGTDVFSGLYSIPTLTIVPEPASVLLVAGVCALWRRR